LKKEGNNVKRIRCGNDIHCKKKKKRISRDGETLSYGKGNMSNKTKYQRI